MQPLYIYGCISVPYILVQRPYTCLTANAKMLKYQILLSYILLVKHSLPVVNKYR
jgi:hypothetical protein